MSIESAFKTHTEADATLSGLSVSVYPHVAPQSASYPFITYEIQGSETERYLNASGTLTELTLSAQVFSDSVSQRAAIMKRMKDIYHGFSGDMGTENLNIRECSVRNIFSFSEQDLTATDEQIYRASLDLVFFFKW